MNSILSIKLRGCYFLIMEHSPKSDSFSSHNTQAIAFRGHSSLYFLVAIIH